MSNHSQESGFFKYCVTFVLGLKQLNGWYNVHDFNGRTVGQIKIVIIPSATLSPSRSAKYFKRHEFVEPVNLDHVFFSTKKYEPLPVISQTDSSIDENNTSRSMLFEQLKVHLHDLGEITSKIKQRSNEATKSATDKVRRDFLPNSIHSSNLEKEQLNHLGDIQSSPVTLDRDGFSRKHVQDKNPDKTLLSDNTESYKEHPLEQDGVISKEFSEKTCFQEFEHDIPGTESLPNCELSHLENNQNSSQPCEWETHSSNVSFDTATEEQPQLNDSTDELLEHLRDFEKKYKHLKEIVQNDSDFEDHEKDDTVLSSDDNNKDKSSTALGGGDAMPPFHSPRDTFRAEQPLEKSNFVFDDVINVSSESPSKEDIEITSRRIPQNIDDCQNPSINDDTDNETERTGDEVVIQALGEPSTNLKSYAAQNDHLYLFTTSNIVFSKSK